MTCWKIFKVHQNYSRVKKKKDYQNFEKINAFIVLILYNKCTDLFKVLMTVFSMHIYVNICDLQQCSRPYSDPQRSEHCNVSDPLLDWPDGLIIT